MKKTGKPAMSFRRLALAGWILVAGVCLAFIALQSPDDQPGDWIKSGPQAMPGGLTVWTRSRALVPHRGKAGADQAGV